MTKPIRLALASAGALLLAGCATGYRQAPVDVTRYHLGQPMERTTVAIEPMSGAVQVSSDYQAYADAVTVELERLGYVRARSDMASGYIAAVSFSRGTKSSFREPPPVSIGLGGGGFTGGRRGGGVGLGGGVSFGLGKGKQHDLIGSELWVQLRRRSDNSTIWEGRAITEGMSDQPGTAPPETAARLAQALFRDFPGESGITITVK